MAWSAVGLVARTELRRTWRTLRPAPDDDYRVLKVGGVLLGYLVYVAGAAATSFFAGAVLARGDYTTDPGQYVRIAGLIPYLLFGFVAIQRVVKDLGDPDERDLLLTTTDHRTLVLGVGLAELTRYLVLAGPLFAVAGTGFGVGTGSALAGVLLVVAATVTTVGAVAVGFAVGFAVKLVGARSAFVARHSTLAGFLAAAALPLLYAVVFLRDPAASAAVARRVAAVVPLAWPAVLPLTTVSGTLAPGVFGVLATGLLVAVASVVSFRLAAALWFGNTVRVEETSSPVLTGSAFDLCGLPTTTRRVAEKSVVRSMRAPFTVQYAVVPLFALFGELQYVVASGTIPARLPVELGFVGAFAAGALFTLNPIGNESAVLPVTLTSGVDGREFVGGLALAAVALTLPVTLLAVAIVGIVSPLPGAWVVGVLAATVVACPAATGVAARYGARHPTHETQSIGDREAVTPSPWAFGKYAVTMAAVCAPGVLAFVPAFVDRLGPLAGVPDPFLRGGLLASSALLLVLVGYGGYASAVRVVETYTLD